MASNGSGIAVPNVRRSSVSSRGLQQGPRLGAIDEDGGMHPDDSSPDSPPRTYGKKLSRLMAFDTGSHHHDRAPPPYSEWDGLKTPHGDNLTSLREKRKNPTRGGWIRTVILILLAIMIIVGLVVGLVLGLRRKHHHKTTSPSTSNDTATFPAGSWSLITFLDTVETDCTSNSATWQCYPYNTINQSSTLSMATFNWIIEPTENDSSAYMVSTTNNPFAIIFTNASLSLMNSGSNEEAYMFSISLDKTVIPTTAITSDGSTAECMYNGTTFTAHLYTKKSKTYPSDSLNSTDDFYQPWPFAVDISQSIAGGASVPDCYKTNNGILGDKVTLQTESSTSTCDCSWQNYGT